MGEQNVAMSFKARVTALHFSYLCLLSLKTQRRKFESYERGLNKHKLYHRVSDVFAQFLNCERLDVE